MSSVNSASNIIDFTDAGVEAQASATTPMIERNRLELIFERKFAYWARRSVDLLQDDIVVFAVFKEFSFVRIDFDIIFRHLQEIGMNGTVKYASFLPNPNFVLIKFKDKGAVARFKNLSNFINQGRVKFISGQEKVRQCKIFINNFPTEFVEADLPKQLENFGKVIRVTPVSVHTGNGEFCEIGQCVVDFLLYELKTLEDLPYFVFIKGFKVFLSIPGKKKICFRCSASTHLVSACPMRFCARCRSLKRLGHLCVVSYATKVIGAERDLHLNVEGVYEDENLGEIDPAPNSLSDSQEGCLQSVDLDRDVLLPLASAVDSSLVQQDDSVLLQNEISSVSGSATVSVAAFLKDGDLQNIKSGASSDVVLPSVIVSDNSFGGIPRVSKPVIRVDGGAVQKRKNVSDNLVGIKVKETDGVKKQYFLRSFPKKVKPISSSSSEENAESPMEGLCLDGLADGNNTDKDDVFDGEST